MADIDPRMVKWDDAPKGPVDPKMVNWDGPEVPGIPQTMLIGLGRGVDKVMAGGAQAYLAARAKMGDKNAQAALDMLSAEQQSNDAAYKPLQEARPFASGIGEAAPMVTPLSAALLGGAQYGDPGERAGRAALNAGATFVGNKVGDVVGRAVLPVRSGINPNQQAALEGVQNAAKDAGATFTPRLSEMTNSPGVARVEDFLARLPGSAGIMQADQAARQGAINQIAAKTIGEKADNLGEGVLGAAADRMGKVFDQIKGLGPLPPFNMKPIQLDNGVKTAADSILTTMSKIPKSAMTADDEAVVALANELKRTASINGRIDGEAYQLLRSRISKMSYNAGGDVATKFGELLKAVDDSAETSLRRIGQGSLADALKEVRPQYGAKMTLEKGMVAEGGDVSAKRLAGALRQQNAAAFREGNAMPGLQEIGRYGEAFDPLKAGSQTMERGFIGSLAQNPLGALAVMGPAYLGAKAVTSPIAKFYAKNGLLMHPLLSGGAADLADPLAGLIGTYAARQYAAPLFGQ